jgi:sugar lactone lactonase YvrE
MSNEEHKLENVRVIGGLDFPECVRWTGRELVFVDGPVVRAVDPFTGAGSVLAEIDTRLCLGLLLRESGTIMVGDAIGARIFSVAPDGHVSLVADLSDIAGSPTNEIILAPDGALLVGRMGFDPSRGEEPRAVSILRLSPDGEVTEVGPDLLFANGLAWDPVTGDLLVAESFASRIRRLRVDGSDIQDRGVFADLADMPAQHPDGLAVTPDGRVWFADVHTGSVQVLDGSGAPVGRIVLDAPHATSCSVFETGETTWVAATVAHDLPDQEFRPRATSALVVGQVPESLC